ncbi:hydroxyacylglutathione hydrolase [Amylibacter marinus]|uniref:Hydroxyacylglutathione hydrolase n=1 Tax=Amylibacter marinus TaxID=1475483 RepID=A0ABQ5VXT2_9RHOB|nr:hydroxyacylglutathione hydrolase [Amylibacter marinus]GLQ36078.1 hydroxyacylglutathione hydrolase [Amylibacter marinus]
MTLDITIIPCLSDNYAYLLRCCDTNEVAVVDVPAAGPILAELRRQKLTLRQIFITHHHADHIDGVAEVVAKTGARVIGAMADAHRLPPLDHALKDGDTLMLGTCKAEVFDVYGHTIGHIAFHFPTERAVFSADSLMALGCGRVNEGTHDQMWQTLLKFKALPTDTLVYSGHEYTASNAKFALSVDPQNSDLIARAAEITATRARGEFCVPSSMALELATNPFLRADTPTLKAAIGMAEQSDAACFSALRTAKDNF